MPNRDGSSGSSAALILLRSETPIKRASMPRVHCRSFQRQPACRALLALFLVFPLAASAQEGASGFSGVSFDSVRAQPLFAQILPTPYDSASTLVFFDPVTSGVMAMRARGDGSFSPAELLVTAGMPNAMATGDLNGDGRIDLILVYRERSTIDVYLSRGGDSGYVPVEFKVNFYPEEVLLADVDGDGNPDILTFGKVSAGITVIACDGHGRFRPPILILPEIPIVEVMPVRLNDDRFPDLVVRDWLNNRLLFYFGMGAMQFSMQRSMAFGQDTAAVALGDLNGDGICDLAVASARERRLKLYEGDGMLGFTNYENLECPRPMRSLSMVRARSSPLPDLLAIAAAGDAFAVFTNRGDGSFHNAVTYGARKGFSQILPADWDGDGRMDLLAVDGSTGVMTTYWNSSQSLHTTPVPGRSVSYAVGVRPQGIATGDIDGDGIPDLIVANNGSASLSLLVNDRDRVSFIRHEIPTSEYPSALRVYGRSDSSATLLVAHEPAARVSVVSIRTDELRTNGALLSVAYAIPTALNPRIILPDAMLQDSVIEFYIYSRERQSSLSYFKQVSGARFLERSLTPLMPSRILAASVDDFNGDAKPDIAYAYRDSESGRYNLAVSFSDSSAQFQGRSRVVVLPDTSIRRCLLLFDDLNGDDISDCIIWSAPSNTIRVALGMGDGKFSAFETVLDRISVAKADHLQFIDFDRDGIDDLAVEDEATGALYLLRGKGNGRFEAPRLLRTLPRGGTLRFGDFDGNGTTDIACTDPEAGVVTIYYQAVQR